MMKIVELEVFKITPSPFPNLEFSLPLTCFDLMFANVSPTERIFFFNSNPMFSPSVLISKLQHSLSLTLSSFLPFAGNLTWPDDSAQPSILYKPGDGVSLTVAETDAEFDRLSANHVHNAADSYFLVPKLVASSNATIAPILSIQVTFFPKDGFSIGLTTNHLVVDGKTTAMFLNSWACICKQNLLTLSPETTPFFDRTALKDLSGFDALYYNYISIGSSQVKKLGLIPRNPISDHDVGRCIFELPRDGIENLRKKVANSQTQSRYISSFILAFAYVSICMIKAQKLEANKGKIALVILVDWRSRSKFPVPINYFGNGVSSLATFLEETEFHDDENALSIVSNRIKDSITEFEEMTNQRKPIDFFWKA